MSFIKKSEDYHLITSFPHPFIAYISSITPTYVPAAAIDIEISIDYSEF